MNNILIFFAQLYFTVIKLLKKERKKERKKGLRVVDAVTSANQF
jgi:hypothetical protein